jgi:malonyl CoA-acyl carrier protein transacylase/acyl carrier protein
MSQSHLIVFPGAAAYKCGALADLAEKHRETYGLLSLIDDVADEFGSGPVSGPLLDPGERDLPALMTDDPVTFHLAIYAASIAVYRARPPAANAPTVLLGLSLGEVMALVAAGAYDVLSGARIVAYRTRIMCELLGGETAAVAIDADAHRTRHLLGAVGNPALAVAVEGAATQTVVAGPAPAVEELRSQAGHLGLRATPIASPFASHHPDYTHVADRLWRAIESLPRRPLRLPVYSPIHSGFYRESDDLARNLADHVCRPVRLRTALETLRDAGVDSFTECSARPLLTPLISPVIPARTAGLPEPTRPPAPAQTDRTLSTDAPHQPPAELPAPAGQSPADPEPGSTNPVAANNPAPESPPATATFESIRDIYAQALGYPEEAFEPDTDMEADLGITSMRQTEILGTVLHRFDLPELPDHFSISAYPTISKILAFVQDQTAGAQAVSR